VCGPPSAPSVKPDFAIGPLRIADASSYGAKVVMTLLEFIMLDSKN
jgi:hypothetical protein